MKIEKNAFFNSLLLNALENMPDDKISTINSYRDGEKHSFTHIQTQTHTHTAKTRRRKGKRKALLDFPFFRDLLAILYAVYIVFPHLNLFRREYLMIF